MRYPGVLLSELGRNRFDFRRSVDKAGERFFSLSHCRLSDDILQPLNFMMSVLFPGCSLAHPPAGINRELNRRCHVGLPG